MTAVAHADPRGGLSKGRAGGSPCGGIGMRHHLVHDYFEVEEQIILRMVETKLPPLVEQLKKILADGVE